MYQNSGMEDLLIESGLYGSCTTSSLLQGKSYNRGIRAHKLLMEALFRLQWCEFLKWLQLQDVSQVEQNLLIQKLHEIRCAIKVSKAELPAMIDGLLVNLQSVAQEFRRFQEESRQKSQLFCFWDDYVTMVKTLLQFIKAERTSNWELHIKSVAAMAPHFNSMDRTNYARWLPVYLADMNVVQKKLPHVHAKVLKGYHAVSRSGQPFNQIWTDMALEQTINRDSKTKGGIIGISQKPGALNCWFITSHERLESQEP